MADRGRSVVPADPRAPERRAGPSAARIRIWLAVAVTVVVIATAGYILLLGWGLSDSLYMTMISLTTVGFQEVKPLDDLGRAWTTVVILSGVALISGSIALVAETALELALRAREAGDDVEGISDHFIVCGYGRVGATTAAELADQGARTVIVELDPMVLAKAHQDGRVAVAGDATEEQTLEAAGIDRCRGIVATMDADVKNVYLTLSARAHRPGVYIIARASSATAEAILRQAGANHVVSPYATAGRRIAELALQTDPQG